MNAQTIFGDDKICGDKCNNENEVIDYDGKCVSKCENSYYKYYEDGKCVQKCSEGKKSLKNNSYYLINIIYCYYIYLNKKDYILSSNMKIIYEIIFLWYNHL